MARKDFSMTQKEADLVVEAMVSWEKMVGQTSYRNDPCVLCHGGKTVPRGTPCVCTTRTPEKCPVYRYTGKHSCYGTGFYRIDRSRAARIVGFAKKMLDDAGYRIGWTRVK